MIMTVVGENSACLAEKVACFQLFRGGDKGMVVVYWRQKNNLSPVHLSLLPDHYSIS